MKVLILSTKDSIIDLSNQSNKWRFYMSLLLGSGVLIILGTIALFMDFEISK